MHDIFIALLIGVPVAWIIGSIFHHDWKKSGGNEPWDIKDR